uniref:Uncharacterized protein n=1 Tax=Cacopsylla melanoneura TaxID=428564 RepID=A0A8D8X5J2_9HEMI
MKTPAIESLPSDIKGCGNVWVCSNVYKQFKGNLKRPAIRIRTTSCFSDLILFDPQKKLPLQTLSPLPSICFPPKPPHHLPHLLPFCLKILFSVLNRYKSCSLHQRKYELFTSSIL